MKKVITIIMLMLLVSVGCKNTRQHKTEFHIRVNCFKIGKNWTGRYLIEYTNDGWETTYPLKETFIVQIWNNKSDVIYQEKLINDGGFVDNNDPKGIGKSKAVAFAKKFKSFSDVQHWQDSVYRKYLYNRDHYKPKPIPKQQPTKECCKIINIQ